MLNAYMTRYCMQKIFYNTACAAVMLLGCIVAAHAQEDMRAGPEGYTQLSCAIHIASTVSDGKYTLEEIADIAAAQGIDVLIPADRDTMSWEYGTLPLRNIIKKRVEERSVFSYGISGYFRRIEALQKAHPGMIIIPGIESAPFYYWQGSPWTDDLTIRDWHKHLLVIGLNKPSDLESLPVLGNPKGLEHGFTSRSIFLFWPALLVAAGAWCLTRRVYSYTDASGKRLGPYSRGWRLTGVTLIFFGILGLINNYPFVYPKFDQYHSGQGIRPYQEFINYANSRQGLTFWAHPEAANIDRSGNVGIETQEHSDHLLTAAGYTGFCIFYEGFKKVGVVAGIWDQLLAAYCRGARRDPVWAIAGLAYDRRGELTAALEDQRTVVLARSPTAEGVLDALRNGRAYCMRGKGSASFTLDEFSVVDASGRSAAMGQEAAVQGPVEIRIRGGLLHGQGRTFTIQLIRDGGILRVFEAQSPFDITYVDTLGSAQERSYYRAQITSMGLIAVTNPIFVKR